MLLRLLIVSTLDSSQPFGAFTRPFYLGMYLNQHFEVYQLGLNCASVDYAQSISVGSRSLRSYVQAVEKCIKQFCPDLVYAQETLPGLAALIVSRAQNQEKFHLAFDFHTLSAFEYWTRLPYASNQIKEFTQFVKTYFAQGSLILANRPIIAASQSITELIPKWYHTKPRRIYSVGNGVPEDFLETTSSLFPDPYEKFRPAKIVVVVAPKTFSFPTNDMSVSMTIEVARYLESHREEIHFVVIGRQADEMAQPLPSNITFVGFLPERSDFLAHLKYANLGLLPFPKQAVAGGARNKALDYFACNKLVVSTPEGLRGLEKFRHLQHLLVTEDSVEDVAKTVLEACINLNHYQPLAEAAYTLIRDDYSWSAMAEQVANILKNEVQSQL
jgi:glycosyltransferase involved in cell wall biosynthesis